MADVADDVEDLPRCWWQVQDSNLCRRKPTDLQSKPSICGRFQLTGVGAGRELGLDQITAVHKGSHC